MDRAPEPSGVEVILVFRNKCALSVHTRGVVHSVVFVITLNIVRNVFVRSRSLCIGRCLDGFELVVRLNSFPVRFSVMRQKCLIAEIERKK